jgi:protoporphyrinogen oxidase
VSQPTIIIGGGLAGLSAAHHLGHSHCLILEKNSHTGGHIYTEVIDGYTWDEGPHLSFTKSNYVRELFEKSVRGDFLEYKVDTGNYYRGSWIPHPAQVNLYAVPEPLRTQCLNDFLAARRRPEDPPPTNYMEWLNQAFGSTFAETFPRAYTRKYWTTDPANLTLDWIGFRVHFPTEAEVLQGSRAPLPAQAHYITTIRYPRHGGFHSYARSLEEGANVQVNRAVQHIAFRERRLGLSTGESLTYEHLILTGPLPELIWRSDAPPDIKDAASRLSCSSLLLINVAAKHGTARPENWFYIYDEEMYSTRINCTEKLSPHNAPTGCSGVQVEVYFSKSKPCTEPVNAIAGKVCAELISMGIVQSQESIVSVHTKWVPYANVIFDNERREALDTILNWLESQGLVREDDDLEPMTDWDRKLKNPAGRRRAGLALAGRYAQWKYYWTDDCVLRGRWLAS